MRCIGLDTGFNCVVKGCSDKIWYIPKDIYIWHFKANSITRIKQGMYGQDSGYKGYLDNMVWQILELQKRFVNKNYILSEIVSIMCVLYHFHVENMQNCPLNTEVSMNWIRGYYQLVYKPYEDLITEDMFMRTFAQVAAGQNIAQKGIIPKITIFEFMQQVRAEPYKNDINEEIRGSTPAGYVPPITSKDWPVEVTEYTTYVEGMVNVDSDTNFSRYGGMKRVLGIPITDKDYDINYDGSDGKTPDNIDIMKEEFDREGIDPTKSDYSPAESVLYTGDPTRDMDVITRPYNPDIGSTTAVQQNKSNSVTIIKGDTSIKDGYAVPDLNNAILKQRIDNYPYEQHLGEIRNCEGCAISCGTSNVMSTCTRADEVPVTPTHQDTTSSKFTKYNPDSK